MKKLFHLLSIIISLICFHSIGQTTFTNEYWSPNFNGVTESPATSDPGQIIQAFGNGDVFMAYSIVHPGGLDGMLFTRVDSDGAIIWSQKVTAPVDPFGNPIPLNYTLSDAVQLSNFIYVVGYTEDLGSGTFGFNGKAPFVIKINGANGNLVWNYSYEDPQLELVPSDIILTSDGGVLVAGILNENSSGPFDDRNFMFKLDQTSGNTQWFNVYEFSDLFKSKAVCENNAGEYVLFFETTTTRLGVFKTNAAGNLIAGSSKRYVIPGGNFNTVLPLDVDYNSTSNNYTLLIAEDNFMPALIRLNSSLDMVWAKRLSASYSFTGRIGGRLEKVNDGYLISGQGNFGLSKNFFLKADNNGDYQWLKALLEDNSSSFFPSLDFVPTNEGIFMPYISDPFGPAGTFNPLTLIKTNLSGDLLATGCETQDVPVATITSTSSNKLNYSIGQAAHPHVRTIPFTFSIPQFFVEENCKSECTQPFVALITTPSTSVCTGDFPVTLTANAISGGPSGYTYLWSDGSTAQTLIVNGPGIYTVTMVNDFGCTSTGTITITQIVPQFMNPITTSTGSNSGCTSMFLFADPGFVSYEWYESTNPSTIIGTGTGLAVNISGTYCVQGTNAAGCVSERCITIVINDPPDVIATQPDLILCCGDGLINLGAEYLSTGNIYWTNNFFMPVDGFSGNIPGPGGKFSSLPACGIVETILGDYKLYQFDPCACDPGSYPVEYTYTDHNTGCSASATMNITIGAPPVISYLDLTIDLCSAAAPVSIPFLTDGVNCTVSGAFVNPQGEFDAAASGVGTFPITITCESASGCETTITGDVVVISSGQWHHTTSNATAPGAKGDVGVDIFTDNQGYVYSTGYFYKETTFNDLVGNSITLTTPFLEPKNFFIVCYDACGELLWVTYDSYDNNLVNSEGFGVEISGDELLVGANFGTMAEFTTVYPNGTTFTYGTTATGPASALGNVAVLALNGPANAGTFGQVNAIETSLTHAEGHALTVRPSNGAIKRFAICGKRDSDQNNSYQVFAASYTYNSIGNTIGSIWVRESTDESIAHVANDIAWDDGLNKFLLTGAFRSSLEMSTNANNTLIVTTPAQSDAFMAFLKPSGYILGNALQNLGIDAAGVATGTTLTSDDNDYIYFGGNYRGTAATPFQIFGLPTTTAISPQASSYVFSIELSSGSFALEQIWNTGSFSNLSGMDAREGTVVLTGTYSKGIPTTGLPTSAEFNLSSTRGLVYVGKMDISSGNWFVPQIVNSTKNASASGADHRATRISIGADDFAFLTGRYAGNLSYFSGTPASGDLNASGFLPTNYNAFFIRNELSTNDLRGSNNSTFVTLLDDVMGLYSELSDESFQIKAFPNPTKAATIIEIDRAVDQEFFDIELYNATGVRLLAERKTSNRFDMDFTPYDAGIYLLRVKVGERFETLRIVHL